MDVSRMLGLPDTLINCVYLVTYIGISLMIKYDCYLIQTALLRDGHYDWIFELTNEIRCTSLNYRIGRALSRWCHAKPRQSEMVVFHSYAHWISGQTALPCHLSSSRQNINRQIMQWCNFCVVAFLLFNSNHKRLSKRTLPNIVKRRTIFYGRIIMTEGFPVPRCGE